MNVFVKVEFLGEPEEDNVFPVAVSFTPGLSIETVALILLTAAESLDEGGSLAT